MFWKHNTPWKTRYMHVTVQSQVREYPMNPCMRSRGGCYAKMICRQNKWMATCIHLVASSLHVGKSSLAKHPAWLVYGIWWSRMTEMLHISLIYREGFRWDVVLHIRCGFSYAHRFGWVNAIYINIIFF